MAYNFTYNGAPLLLEVETVIPFKTGLQDYEGQKLECKMYRYKVASDFAVEVFVPKINPTGAYSRGVLLNSNNEVIAVGTAGTHFNKKWAKDYLKAFNKKNKPGLAWIEAYRRELLRESRDDSQNYVRGYN
jgi:hypothetical protein